MSTTTTVPQTSKWSALQLVTEKSDRIMTIVMVAYFAFGVFLAFFYDTWFIAFGVGGLCLAAYFLTKALLPEYRLYQYLLSAILAIFSAQFIYQMHGLFEMHFFFFVGSTLLITYRNWKLMLPLLVLTVVHHASFAWIQYSGMKEIYFTQLDYMDLQAFLFHAALAAVIMGICGFWAYDLGRTTRSDSAKHMTLEKQVSNIKNNIAFAEAITNGDLEKQYDLLDENDELGKSLLKMRDSLRRSNEREEEEKFITVGITKISDIIRQHNDNPVLLAENFINGLVRYTKLNQGALFIHETTEDEEYLRLAACYAYDRKKYLEKKLSIGEGLVGQCFLERQPIYMTAVPKDYAKITSGLGAATPQCIYIVPVKTEDEIAGVIELASFEPLSEYEKQFIQHAADNIASAIISTRTTFKIKELLNDAEHRTEAMQAQEEEMRQNLEELQATQEEMARKQVENDNRIKAIDESGIASIEFNMDGIIQTANDAFLKLMGYTLSEIQGKHHRMFVDSEHAESAFYRKFWEDLSNGISRPGEYERVSKKGQKVYIQGSYSIIYDQQHKPAKVLKLATDITDIMNQRQENENRMRAINESGIASIEFSLNGNIIEANESFLKLMGYSLKEIQGKHHRIFVPEDIAASKEYEKFWKDLGNGIARPGQYQRKTSSGKTIFIQGSYSVLRDRNGKPTRIIKLATDITKLVAHQMVEN